MKKIFTRVSTFVCCMLLSVAAFAQPANDNCSGAIAISVEPFGTTCSASISAVTTAATASTVVETSCTTANDNDDIFYSFTATGTTQVLRFSGMVATAGTATTLGYRVYSGSCAALTQVGSCDISFGTSGAGSTFITGLTAGQSYYLQLFAGGSSTNTATFNFCLQEDASVPPNDECSGAISLTQNATCVTTAGTTAGATESMAASPCTGTTEDDVWYSFVANSTDAQIAISGQTAVVGTSTTTYFQIFSGSCAGLSSIMCSTAATGIVGGLTAGNTYYIRVYTSLNTSRINFNICVNDLATAPTVCTSLSSPATGAQVSTATTLTWTATANASGYDIYLDTNNPPTTLYASVENGNSTSYTITTPLSPGTYYWYVVPRNSVGAMTGCEANTRNFIALPQPANDECTAAINLTPAAIGVICTGTAGTTSGGTRSLQSDPSCSATGINDDVWYSFTATNSSHMVVITGATNTTAAAVYSGASCATATQLTGLCGSTSSGTLNLTATGLTVGTVYYVRVYTTVTTITTFSNFNICIGTLPANDECAGAVAGIPVTTFGNSCIYTPVNTTYATESTSTGQAACTTTGINDDVWYTFTTTIAGNYSFSYTNLVAVTGTASTVGMATYTGACGALTEVTGGCSTGFGTGGSGTYAVELAASTNYTLRLWVGAASNSGTFNFCITSPVPPPANDECSGATSLPAPSATFTCATPTAGTTFGATESTNAAPTCSATGINDDVWYSFTATSSAHTVLISNATNTTAAALYSGTCGGTLTQLSCGTGGASFGALIPGTVYYVRVYTTVATLATTSNFDICVVSGAPTNDECASATSLTPSVNLACSNPVAGSTNGSTPSPDPAPSCSPTAINDDVWYSFVATNTVHTVLVSNASSTTAAAVYGGTCGSLTQIVNACGSGLTGSALAVGLTIGNTYYVRVYTTSLTVGTYSDFDICIVSGSPANDNCSGAIDLPVSVNNSCSNALTGTTIGATASTEAATTCTNTGTGDDVWYKFTATATTHSVSIFNDNTTTAVSVYSGACGGLTLVSCASSNLLLTGLTIGQVYYVRVHSTSTTIGVYSNFSICVGVIPPNDNCAGAIPLTASSTNNCNSVYGSTLGATATTGEATTTCAGSNDDVWYSFVAAATTQIVSLSNVSSTSAVTIYSGACGGLTFIACGTTTATATGLTVGNTYYVRVYTTSTTATTYSTFDICVSAPPTNDECVNAITLTNNVPVNGSNVYATASMGITSCTGIATASNEVWYQFTALSSGSALISLTNVAATMDAVIFAYSGSCGALTNIGCADGPADGGSETIALSGLVAGQTYYIRVFGFASTDNGTFTITVSGAALPVTIEYFKGNKQTAGNRLEWKLACINVNTAVVELERSSDGRNFTTISTYNISNGNCSDIVSYLDAALSKSTYYYRLKITEMGGSVDISNTVALLGNNKGFEVLAISPNPAPAIATLEIAGSQKASLEVVITDVAGRRMQSRKVNILEGINKIPMQLAGLGQGVYYVTVLNENGERKTLKLIKQ